MEEENKSENYYEREYNEKYDTYDLSLIHILPPYPCS